MYQESFSFEIMKVSVNNETGRLKSVIVGRPESQGAAPTLSEAYDARSYQSIEEGDYPSESAITKEMNGLVEVLTQLGVEVLRPTPIENCNQIFARDISFVIGDHFYVANVLEERTQEQKALQEIIHSIPQEKVTYLEKEGTSVDHIRVEGGDVMLYDDIVFLGVTEQNDGFDRYKTARTNRAALEYFQRTLPHKRFIPLHLKKHDTHPKEGILHVDCAFQPVGKGKAVYYPEGFACEEERKFIEELFGKENLFSVTAEEAYRLATNFVSVAPNKVILEEHFTRLAQHLSEQWNIQTYSIPYAETSKQGGLLRCSTCPLIRE